MIQWESPGILNSRPRLLFYGLHMGWSFVVFLGRGPFWEGKTALIKNRLSNENIGGMKMFNCVWHYPALPAPQIRADLPAPCSAQRPSHERAAADDKAALE